MRVLLIVLLGILLLTNAYVPPIIAETEGTYSTLLVIKTEDLMIARIVNDMDYPIKCFIVSDETLLTKSIGQGERLQLLVETRKPPTWRCKPI
jgi:hypothetical protein